MRCVYERKSRKRQSSQKINRCRSLAVTFCRNTKKNKEFICYTRKNIFFSFRLIVAPLFVFRNVSFTVVFKINTFFLGFYFILFILDYINQALFFLFSFFFQLNKSNIKNGSFVATTITTDNAAERIETIEISEHNERLR